ncbi:DUF4470 domain-containing protein [Phanerochaete sordida]|uniref:DUF4470 domain-containing protein n=1 Tax=Phanerochaete sordida TaxID=48140 RepID=A0A9P3GE91_9APHY|nr:DUF4470 domain-containing protein [Phanerochaete sordida]
MPAIDILKLAPSKSKSEAEMNLAFIASGDLRNVMETVNGLPQDFAGTLKVVMNDRDVYVTLRNIIMLEILARTPNKRRAADIVLHLWYSAFLPDEYDVEITAIGMDLATATGALHVELGSNAALDADISDELRALCSLLLVFSRGYGADHAMQELTRVRFNSDRVDFRHRQWLRCEPSHRLALLEYTKYGLVLPFGAHKAHFKNPNRFLFSPNGVWLQSDGVNPLDSWDIEEVVASGMAHGATRDDLYGCLYYHVAGQLQKFASRLARMRISFNITNLDALELAKSMWRNDLADIGIPAKIRFDRIDVSNLFDEDYLGVARVLDAWGGFIRRGTGGGVIVGHMINWIGREPSARTTDVNDRLFEKLLRRLPLPKMRKNPSVDEIRVLQGMLVAMAHGVATAQDHSKAFEVHLSKQRISHALLRAELKRRAVHEIVPHRLCAPLSAAPAALPDLENDEAWYLRVHVASPMWTERYLEIVPT